MTPRTYYDEGDVPEFHRLTGEAIRIWTHIEGELERFVKMGLGVDQFRSRLIMGSIVGSRAKREFATRLAETYLDASLLPRFRGLMKRMKSLGKTRNTLAHTPMHVNLDGKENKVMGDVFSDAMDGGLDFDFYDFPLNDLRVFRESLEQLFRDLSRFMFDCDGHFHHKARIHRELEARGKKK